VVLMHGGFFLVARMSVNTTMSVECDGGMVHDGDVVHVHVDGVVSTAKTVIGGVIEEVTAAPLATNEAYAEVAEAIVDAAIEADVRAPVAGVEAVIAAFPTPPRGCPEITGFRRDDPGAGNPVIAAVICIGPVARRPDVAVAGADGLYVDRKRWRRNADLDDDWLGLGRSGGKKRQRKSHSCRDRETAYCEFEVHQNLPWRRGLKEFQGGRSRTQPGMLSVNTIVQWLLLLGRV